MSRRTNEGESDSSGGRTIWLSRRGFLTSAGVGVLSSVAGCGERIGTATATGAEETPSQTPTSTPTAATTKASHRTSSSSETTKTTTRHFDTSVLDASPSSQFAPTDGFGSVEWLSEANPDVVTVTNLDRSGEGSLPWALNQSAPRIVVFEVGGVIDLRGRTLSIDSGDLYVAGQTAPSPGVTVIRGGIYAGGENTLVQHLRVRPGDELDGGPIDGDPGGNATDALSVDNDTSNVIFDHCSVSWGSDENMSASGGRENTDLTFSNNLIAEGLSHSPLHPEKEHSKGTLINDWATDTAVLGNVYVHHTDRHPRIKGGASCAAVNNFVYNYAEAVEMGGGPDTPALGSIVGNYFKAGPATDGTVPLIVAEGQGGARAYVENNVGEPSIGEYEHDLYVLTLQPVWPVGIEPMDARGVPEHNLASAGARPADRTFHDQRVVKYARLGKGERIDSQTEVGGYPDFPSTERLLDPPAVGDGLADWLHHHTRAVELPGASPP